MGSDGLRRRGRIWHIDTCFRGHRIRQSCETEDRNRAVSILRQRQAEVDRRAPLALRTPKLTFTDLARDFITDYRVNGKRSVGEAEKSVAHLAQYFGGYRAVNITTHDVRAYIEAGLLPRLDIRPHVVGGDVDSSVATEILGEVRHALLSLADRPLPIHAVVGDEVPGEVNERELRGAQRDEPALVQFRLPLSEDGDGLIPVVGLAGFANPVPADAGVDMPDRPASPEPVSPHATPSGTASHIA